MTEINLFDTDEPLAFKHILIYPYPDLKRLWIRAWLPAMVDTEPNVEYRIYNPDGSENSSLVLLTQTDTKLDNTLHMKEPIQPGATYQVEAVLSVGLSRDAEVVDRRQFEMVLEFRNPEKKELGFGVGLDELFEQEDGG